MERQVVCIKTGTGDKLTIGKVYTVVYTKKYTYTNRIAYTIYDDDKLLDMYYSWRFISIQEYRKLKLKKLNETISY